MGGVFDIESTQRASDALRDGQAAAKALRRVRDVLDRGRRVAYWDLLTTRGILSPLKLGFYLQAKLRARAARRALDRFQASLSRIEREHTAECRLSVEFEPLRMTVRQGVDIGFDTMSSNRVHCSIAISRVERIVRELQAERDAREEAQRSRVRGVERD